jgi:CRP/FNR family transcriptional regulator, cyclic AMP receptor protein
MVTANDGAQSVQEFNAMLETRQQIETALRASFIFPLLAPSEQDRFIAAAIPQSWSADAPIFFMGDAGASMMLVQAGEIRISRPSASGRMIILNELKPGAVFGEIALLDGGERSADATATTNCKLLVFERRSFVTLLDNNWPLAEALLKLVCSRLRRADERVADLVFSDLPGRLAKELLARARPGPNGGPMRVSDTQNILAALVGGSRETVNRCLRNWEKSGLIATANGRISLLDPAGLARQIG